MWCKLAVSISVIIGVFVIIAPQQAIAQAIFKNDVAEQYLETVEKNLANKIPPAYLIDEYIKVNDKDSFQMARRLIREEGLLIGGSSGSAVWAALQKAKDLSKNQKCLVILPDSIRNYLTKFADDTWMTDHEFI